MIYVIGYDDTHQGPVYVKCVSYPSTYYKNYDSHFGSYSPQQVL